MTDEFRERALYYHRHPVPGKLQIQPTKNGKSLWNLILSTAGLLLGKLKCGGVSSMTKSYGMLIDLSFFVNYVSFLQCASSKIMLL